MSEDGAGCAKSWNHRFGFEFKLDIQWAGNSAKFWIWRRSRMDLRFFITIKNVAVGPRQNPFVAGFIFYNQFSVLLGSATTLLQKSQRRTAAASACCAAPKEPHSRCSFRLLAGFRRDDERHIVCCNRRCSRGWCLRCLCHHVLPQPHHVRLH
jgi:hypothetical protein